MTVTAKPSRRLVLALFGLALLALPAALPGGARAQSAEQKGLAIATEAEARSRGYNDMTVDGEMTLLSQGGTSGQRRFDLRWTRAPGGSRALLVFGWPGDIRNTALLTHGYEGRTDDQWLWLPDLNKVRRISSSGRSGSFVGSEFAYEDMTDQEPGKFTHRWIADEPCPGGGTCHVVERRPRGGSGYAAQRVWFDTAHLRVQQVMYFDRRGAHLKTLRMSGYRLYNGRWWRASRMDMRNHLTGRATVLSWSNFRFNTGVEGGALTPDALRRLR
jgi:outer membrane lipoprotein-sorting protein